MTDTELLTEVLQLTLALGQGEATDEEHARLERLLSDEPRAIDYYLRIVGDTLTFREAAAACARGGAEPSCPCTSEPQQSAAPAESPRHWARAGHRAWLSLSIAAGLALVLAGAAWLGWSTRDVVARQAAVAIDQSARVISAANVQWATEAERFADWSSVAPGSRLRFDSGVLGLYLASGVELLIEGPADVDYISPAKMVARQGKLAARVGPEAAGFIIETPHAQVIDRGTSFGLSVDANERTAVVVYEGMVDLDVTTESEHRRRRLTGGEGLSVDIAGELRRITTVEASQFLLPPARVRLPSSALVIAAVSDSAQSLETTKYYRIVPGGFQEDCRSYVDRQHEWNGIDERGLPPFLLGGDYVMTFNDDKIVTQIEMAVTLRQPASVFVLFDDRVAPPEWLTRDFTLTNWKVGSDEGYAHRDDVVTDLGPGRSIDHEFSVWRRDVADASTVILGALTEEESERPARDVERSMYGVVAVPLQQVRSQGVD